MAVIQKKIDMIGEARATGRGNKLWLECLKFIGVLVVAGLTMELLGTFLGGLILGVLGVTSPFANTLVSLYGEIIGIGMVIGYCVLLEKRTVRSMGFRGRDFALQYLKGLGIGFGMMAVTVLLGWALGGFRYKGLSDSIRPGILLAFFIGYMIQGMCEEVMCRGYLMISVARKNSIPAAVITNAVVFMLLHGLNPGFGPLPILNLFLFGVFASLYMLKTGNIWGVGAIHSIWNFAQGNFFGLSVSGTALTPTVFVFGNAGHTLINGGVFGPEGGIPVTLVYGVGIAVLLLLAKKEESAQQNEVLS